jgi:apolipoprotein N-acyltransferase
MVVAASGGGRWRLASSARRRGASTTACVCWRAKANETALYDKAHLVPFGEYIPFGDLAYDWFGCGPLRRRRATPIPPGRGRGAGPWPLRQGPAADLLRGDLPARCECDARAGRLDAADHQRRLVRGLDRPVPAFRQARLRAVEQGLPLIRVANTGVTAVVDARGRVVAACPSARWRRWIRRPGRFAADALCPLGRWPAGSVAGRSRPLAMIGAPANAH